VDLIAPIDLRQLRIAAGHGCGAPPRGLRKDLSRTLISIKDRKPIYL